MIRTFLARGDRAGEAEIMQGLDSVACSNPPPAVQIATLGMKTYCWACKQEGYIAPRGPRRPGAGPNGKQWALSGDINICGCNPPPVFYPVRERHMTMSFTSDEVAAFMGSASSPAISGAENVAYDQCFQLVNPRTARPLRDMPYRIVSENGGELEGRTDEQGYTQRITADNAYSATLHVLEEAPPLNPEWDKYL